MSDLFDTIFGVPKNLNKRKKTKPIQELDRSPRCMPPVGHVDTDSEGYFISEGGHRVAGSCVTCGKGHRVMIQMQGRYVDGSDDYYYCHPCYIGPINEGRYGSWCAGYWLQYGKRKRLPAYDEWLLAHKANDYTDIDEKYKLGRYSG